jgi:hypothetical protein
MDPFPRLLEVPDRFSLFGLPIQITEFDVAVRNEEVQAQYPRDFCTAVSSHPATLTFQFYSIHGDLIQSGVADHSGPGPHSTSFDVSLLQPGIYICVIKSGSQGTQRRTLRIIME